MADIARNIRVSSFLAGFGGVLQLTPAGALWRYIAPSAEATQGNQLMMDAKAIGRDFWVSWRRSVPDKTTESREPQLQLSFPLE